MPAVGREIKECAIHACRSTEWGSLLAQLSGSKRCFRLRRIPGNVGKAGEHRSSSNPHGSREDGSVRRKQHFAGSTAIGADGRKGNKSNPYAGPRGGTRSIFKRDEVRHSRLAELILAEYNSFRHAYSQPEAEAEVASWGIKTRTSFKKWSDLFQQELNRCCATAVGQERAATDLPSLFAKLRHAYISRDRKGLTAVLKFSFINYVVDHGFSPDQIANQQKLANLSYPLEWYPETRAMQRKIHLHVGPTNSGKTYQALKRLEEAPSGIYAGPLRLLAHEVYTRLNAKGRPCALVTGEERRVPENQEVTLSSCTVEMVPLNARVDVAVIDEIQMMGDIDRGWAWTQVLLGLQANELHLCGELRTVPLIQDLCAAMGDSLEIHEYERLSPLETMNKSLQGDLKRLQKGDAIIVFSRVGIHAMKKEVERATGRRCAVVYGSLPPETRAQQARLFNDPDNDYDFLVASDAVGMGLNLSIKRIVFETTSKHDGTSHRTLQVPELKQIAGRAGRYRTASQAVEGDQSQGDVKSAGTYPLQLKTPPKTASTTLGLVTALESFDMPILQRAMSSEVEPLPSAGLLAPSEVLRRFAAYFPPETPLSYILLRLHDFANIHPRFHLCRFKDHIPIADAIQEYDLMIDDRIIFVAAPASSRDEGMVHVLKALARCVANHSGGELLDIPEINLELLDEVPDLGGKEYLRNLEALHKALTLYLWLSYRFAGIFRSQPLAFHVKSLVEEKIDDCLGRVQMDSTQRKRLIAMRKKTAMSGLVETGDKTEDVEALEDDASTEPTLPEDDIQMEAIVKGPEVSQNHQGSASVGL
jgi:ATP-dependent RNA helicase SUPV3L1/SUV3